MKFQQCLRFSSTIYAIIDDDFGGITRMKFDKTKWNKIIKSITAFFKDEKLTKKVNITYQIVWNLALLFMIIIILGASFAGGVGAGYFASLIKDEPIRSYESMQKDIYNYEETTELYFANDVYLGKLYSDIDREEVKIDKISDNLKNAVISTEDEYFYQHDGVVPKAILRAVFQEVTNSSIQTGGSTLTQQLIKNQILTNEISFERKAKEILLALRLEKFFEKEEILEAYLNVTTFGRNSSGRNIAGVQSAAKGIFGVNVNELNLPQSAFIAGLPQSPFGYTPYTNKGEIKNNLEPGITRMKTVLKRMYDDEKITKQQYEEAIAYDITKDFITIHENPVEDYPWVTFEIEKRARSIMSVVLAEKDGYTEEELNKDESLNEKYMTLADRDIRQNGYRIHSTINKDMYDRMNEAAQNYQYYGSDKSKTSINPETGKTETVPLPVETGAILIENKTGKILSFVGGRDYNRESTNRATKMKRQNGSTMKPLLVYAPAMEMGLLSPGSILPDVPLKLNPASNKPWPANFDGRYHGLLTAREALAHSYNMPAVKTYVDIFDYKPMSFLEKMGFTSLTESDYSSRSAAIGGLSDGVTVEENTNAFTTFANNGQFIDAYLIDKITDKEGNIIYQHEVKPVEVFSPQTAYLTYDMLRDVMDYGTAGPVRNKLKFSTDWAGKTGTTNEYKDAWFIGLNPNVTLGTWIGYDEQKQLEERYKGIPYYLRNIYLWADLINAAYDVAPDLIGPKTTITAPDGIVTRSICGVSGLLPSEACADAGLVRTDLFNAKFIPTKADDTLTGGRYVMIGGKRYPALDTTPEEFTEAGLMLNMESIKRLFGVSAEIGTLVPKDSSLSKALLPEATLQDNGKAPSALNISVSGTTISWGHHPENDIVGYRVYRDGKKVSSMKTSGTLSYQVGNGTYYVTAVDISGRESEPSNLITVGQPDPIEVGKPTEGEPSQEE